MPEAIVITPVKDSLETCKRTVNAIMEAEGAFEYFVFDDFSQQATRDYLDRASASKGFRVIHLDELTDTPSPNYKLVLQMAQDIALKATCPLLIIESDVVIAPNTISQLLYLSESKEKAGMIGAITVDGNGAYNFPYTFEKKKSWETVSTHHSLSFCCTLLTYDFLSAYSFKNLADDKHWFDVHISRQSIKLGYRNYLAKGLEVLHLPHSSRPWKNLKYKNPFLYYLKKIFLRRDRI